MWTVHCNIHARFFNFEYMPRTIISTQRGDNNFHVGLLSLSAITFCEYSKKITDTTCNIVS